MDKKKIQGLIDIAKENQINSLSYEKDGEKISVTINAAVTSSIATAIPVHQNENVDNQISSNEADYIKAPFVGTFYNAPSPGAKAYVQVGDKVSKGDTLCILEAMKIMNEIEAEKSGIIEKILVDNESFVEFGQNLFQITSA